MCSVSLWLEASIQCLVSEDEHFEEQKQKEAQSSSLSLVYPSGFWTGCSLCFDAYHCAVGQRVFNVFLLILAVEMD